MYFKAGANVMSASDTVLLASISLKEAQLLFQRLSKFSLEVFTSRRILQAAQRDVSKGKVDNLCYDKKLDWIQGQIHTEADSKTYYAGFGLDFDQKPDITFSECSCSKDTVCRHIVAVFFAYEATLKKIIHDQTIEIDAKQSLDSIIPEPQPAVRLPYNIQQWSNLLKKSSLTNSRNLEQNESKPGTLTKPRSSLASARRMELQFSVLDLSPLLWQNSLRLHVSFHYETTTTKEGKIIDNTASFSFFKLTKQDNIEPPYSDVSRKDLELLTKLFLAQGKVLLESENVVKINSFYAEARLVELLKSERCKFQESPLSLGGTIEPQLIWKDQQDGTLVPKIVTPDNHEIAKIFQLPSALWYLSSTTKQLGKLKSEFSPDLIKTFLSAPEILPHMRNEANRSLGPILSTLGLPIVQQVEDIHLKGIDPTPVLVLRSEKKYIWEHNRGVKPEDLTFRKWNQGRIKISQAHLAFKYGDFMIAEELASHKKTLEVVKRSSGNQLFNITRNLEKEAELTTDLLKLCNFQRFDDQPHCFWFGLTADSWDNFDAWANFLDEVKPTLETKGWEVIIDSTFIYNIVEVDEWNFDIDDSSDYHWFELGLKVKAGGKEFNLVSCLSSWLSEGAKQLNLTEFKNASPEECVFIPIDEENNTLIPFPKNRLYNFLQTIVEVFDRANLTSAGRIKLSRFQIFALSHLKEQFHGSALKWQASSSATRLLNKLADCPAPNNAPAPSSFRATLRSYQQTGVDWLEYLRQLGLNGILADDMGLGKTVQTLALLSREKEAGRMTKPSLIICPKSVINNWTSEAEKFAPNLRVVEYHGPNRQSILEDCSSYDLIITNYSLLGLDFEKFLKMDFYYSIMDEAQALKNPKTNQACVAAALRSEHKLCLTGTPLENHLEELWSLFNIIMPGLLGDRNSFREYFRVPIEKHASSDRRDALVQRIAPFMLRRRKIEIAKELPSKTEIIRTVELDDEQRDLYEAIRATMSKRVREEISKRGLSSSYIIVLDALLKLRQVCNDPRLLNIPGVRKVKKSAKMDCLRELLPQLIQEGRRVLLFSQFAKMLNLIEDEVKKLKIPYVMLTGRTNHRKSLIDTFQKGEVPLFLISLKAGGSGINLTAADTVIHYDPWWNPAVENQATDRAHRIGQDKPVFVYKLIAQGTIEETMIEMQRKKHGIFDAVIDEGESYTGQITAEDIESIFKPISLDKDKASKSQRAKVVEKQAILELPASLTGSTGDSRICS